MQAAQGAMPPRRRVAAAQHRMQPQRRRHEVQAAQGAMPRRMAATQYRMRPQRRRRRRRHEAQDVLVGPVVEGQRDAWGREEVQVGLQGAEPAGRMEGRMAVGRVGGMVGPLLKWAGGVDDDGSVCGGDSTDSSTVVCLQLEVVQRIECVCIGSPCRPIRDRKLPADSRVWEQLGTTQWLDPLGDRLRFPQ